MGDMVEQMMKDPKMQEMMYPYLPGGMPGINPEMANMMNMKDEDFKKQFENVGMSPEEVLKKIMEEPELAAAFQNPRVQQAMMDCSANPMNISKYTGDKEVMDAMIKMSQLFPGMGAPPAMT